MHLPYLTEIPTTRDMIQEFRGYNHNDVIRENEFYDMQNMTSSRYPVLSPREKRGVLQEITKPNGIFSKGRLYWVDGTSFYGNDGDDGETMLRGAVADSSKMFASMGAYLLIWPDKKFYNTSTKLFGDLEKVWEAAADTNISLTLAKLNYESKATEDFTDAITVSATAPENPADGLYWYDTSPNPDVLKRWSASAKSWIPAATTYVKISAPNIGVGFSRNDGVKIDGCTNTVFNQTFVIQDVAQDYITIIGILQTTHAQVGGLSVSRTVPDIEFITEADNRLWGCSSEKHEIYSCKLGDPFNWNCFEGIASDSYAATIGSDGDFTGAVTYAGYVWFFKEGCVHKIMGSKPANYQLTEMVLRGVEKGSERSLSIVNETLYYKSRNGIVAFQGGMPENISDALGNVKYRNAAAGALGDKYYISMQDSSGGWHMFVFDERRGMWHREDNIHAADFVLLNGSLYFTNAADNKVYSVTGSDGDEIEWFVETGDLGMNSPDRKHISKIILRMELETGSSISVGMQFDSEGDWKTVYRADTNRKRSFLIPVIPYRCDHFRIRIAGKGVCKIFSISKVTEQGSEL